MVLFGFIETNTRKIYFVDYKIENILKRWICENVKRCTRKSASSISQKQKKIKQKLERAMFLPVAYMIMDSTSNIKEYIQP
jgi:ribosomal protein S18